MDLKPIRMVTSRFSLVAVMYHYMAYMAGFTFDGYDEICTAGMMASLEFLIENEKIIRDPEQFSPSIAFMDSDVRKKALAVFARLRKIYSIPSDVSVVPSDYLRNKTATNMAIVQMTEDNKSFIMNFVRRMHDINFATERCKIELLYNITTDLERDSVYLDEQQDDLWDAFGIGC